MMHKNNDKTTRRDVLRVTVAAAASVGAAGPGAQAAGPDVVEGQTLRDRFWIWTHAEGAYKLEYGLPRTSRMTPVEGAVYLGVHNLLFIRYGDEPPMPFDDYAISFRPMKRVVWSITGA